MGKANDGHANADDANDRAITMIADLGYDGNRVQRGQRIMNGRRSLGTPSFTLTADGGDAIIVNVVADVSAKRERSRAHRWLTVTRGVVMLIDPTTWSVITAGGSTYASDPSTGVDATVLAALRPSRFNAAGMAGVINEANLMTSIASGAREAMAPTDDMVRLIMRHTPGHEHEILTDQRVARYRPFVATVIGSLATSTIADTTTAPATGLDDAERHVLDWLNGLNSGIDPTDVIIWARTTTGVTFHMSRNRLMIISHLGSDDQGLWFDVDTDPVAVHETMGTASSGFHRRGTRLLGGVRDPPSASTTGSPVSADRSPTIPDGDYEVAGTVIRHRGRRWLARAHGAGAERSFAGALAAAAFAAGRDVRSDDIRRMNGAARTARDLFGGVGVVGD
jgi:hypothetical protein